MSSEQFDLFLVLLKLKSYLVSLIEQPSNLENPLEFTEEFLDRKYPERKEEILNLLSSFNIISDSQIAFDEKIHFKFREMVNLHENSFGLSSILSKFNIESLHESNRDKSLNEIKTEREEKLKKIISLLFRLASIWTKRGDLERNVEDFSVLAEEELIRPDEQKELGKLDDDTMISFEIISKLSNLYLENLIEYYFKFGGDIALSDFVQSLDKFKLMVDKKYKELFNKSGLQ